MNTFIKYTLFLLLTMSTQAQIVNDTIRYNTTENRDVPEKLVYYSTGALFERTEQYVLSIFYREAGSELGRLEYKDYQPHQGTEYCLVSGKLYHARKFDNSEIVYEAYYSPDNLSILKKTYKALNTILTDLFNNTNNSKDIQILTDTIPSLHKELFYTNRVLTKKNEYYEDNGLLKLEVHYLNKFPILEHNYYRNGNRWFTKEYTDKNSPGTATLFTFYNKDGQKIGRYDDLLKTGTFITYDDDNEDITTIQVFLNDKLISLKNYAPNKLQDSKGYFLLTEMDISQGSISYNENGQVIAKATFKDGDIYDGTIYTLNNDILKQISVKNGKLWGNLGY